MMKVGSLCSLYETQHIMTGMKIYTTTRCPLSMACRQCFKVLGVKYTHIPIDFFNEEHRTEEFAQLNPQKEVPVLDDNGFYLSESNAILQYVVEKYGKDDMLYPADPHARALVNHRLCFNLGSYYKQIFDYVIPLYYKVKDANPDPEPVKNVLCIYNEYLKRTGHKYAAANHLTIADFQLLNATMCLEAFKFDISPYPLVHKWYCTFKKDNPDLWAISDEGMQDIIEFAK